MPTSIADVQSRTIEEYAIDLLGYPRWLAQHRIPLSNCPHSGFYNSRDRTCWDCAFAAECRWLNGHDEPTMLETKSSQQLFDALEFAIDYVRSDCSDHHRRSCMCDSCSWLRTAMRLYKAYNERRPTN